jgi:hypothetical protein
MLKHDEMLSACVLMFQNPVTANTCTNHDLHALSSLAHASFSTKMIYLTSSPAFAAFINLKG